MPHESDERLDREQQRIDNLPDPNGPVQPVPNQEPTSPDWRRQLAGLVLGGLGVGVVIAAFAPASCAGATRSSRLKWQEQQTLINQAINEQTADGESDGHNADLR